MLSPNAAYRYFTQPLSGTYALKRAYYKYQPRCLNKPYATALNLTCAILKFPAGNSMGQVLKSC